MSRYVAARYAGTPGFPRLRGDEPTHVTSRRFQVDVFPAYAGMSPLARRSPSSPPGFPRLRGDEPTGATLDGITVAFSPPTRG